VPNVKENEKINCLSLENSEDKQQSDKVSIFFFSFPFK
jgi:hypothetical protein